jgi:hypothetical protein
MLRVYMAYIKTINVLQFDIDSEIVRSKYEHVVCTLQLFHNFMFGDD